MSSQSGAKYGKKITVTQISDNQFLIEGESNKLRVGGESEYAISYIDLHGGPFLHLGCDFLGRGKIKDLEIIDSETLDYAIIKVTLDSD